MSSCFRISKIFPLEGKSGAPIDDVAKFIYKISEHRIGKIALYVVIFAAVFAFIVMYLIHLEGGVL
jgi:hypothetical protein